MRKFLLKAFKRDQVIVKKSDDELMRYIKQTNIMKNRKKFEELMRKEDEERAKGLNAEEKRQLHF